FRPHCPSLPSHPGTPSPLFAPVPSPFPPTALPIPFSPFFSCPSSSPPPSFFPTHLPHPSSPPIFPAISPLSSSASPPVPCLEILLKREAGQRLTDMGRR
ncbi:unnamed protein product, partial [Closterium sp. NIES-54]